MHLSVSIYRKTRVLSINSLRTACKLLVLPLRILFQAAKYRREKNRSQPFSNHIRTWSPFYTLHRIASELFLQLRNLARVSTRQKNKYKSTNRSHENSESTLSSPVCTGTLHGTNYFIDFLRTLKLFGSHFETMVLNWWIGVLAILLLSKNFVLVQLQNSQVQSIC